MEILTPRLRLRPARPDDAGPMHTILSDPQAMAYWSTPPHADLEETRAWIGSMISSPPELAEDFIVEHEGRLIGKAGFFRLPEIGYILHPDSWGRGLAREALGAVIAHVFAARPQIATLTADVDPRNTASLRLLERLGFVRTGFKARTWNVGGTWCDSVYLALERN